jgi:hypothetical protein
MTIYTYYNPFVVTETYQNTIDNLLEYTDESDRTDLATIRDIVLKFIIVEGLIFRNGDDELCMNLGTDVGTWQWALCSMNFRSLVSMDQYSKLMRSLELGDQSGITKIIDLHFRLGSNFDARVLNTLITRIMKSIQVIPYHVPEESTKVEWDTIHVETPFIWLIIYIQGLVRNETTKV